MPRQHKTSDYASVNWQLADSQIARELGVPQSAVFAARKRWTYRGNPRVVSRGRPIWTPPPDIDWSSSNSRLAREQGVAWRTVRRARVDAGAVAQRRCSACGSRLD